MTGPLSALVSLGILSLLLVTAGVLFVFFDWSAARRREFLYLYFAEDKPGAGYFSAARRRRAQYTRLLLAFLTLFAVELLTVNLLLTSSTPHRYQNWVHCWWMMGLALLGLGFLFNPDSTRKPHLDTLFFGFLCAWSLFVAALALNVWGERTNALARIVPAIVQGVLSFVFVLASLKRREEKLAMGLLRANPIALALAFGVWGIGALVSLTMPVNNALLTLQFAAILSFGILVPIVAKSMLSEYEYVEGSRHRLGRERQVIIAFLQRIGAAFTTAVEVEQVLKIILESALETTEASAGAIYLYDKDLKQLSPRVVLNFFPPLHVDTLAALSERRTEELEAEMVAQTFDLGEGVIGEVAKEGRARIVSDVRAEGIMLGTTTEFMRNRSMLLVPLKIRDEPLGVMAVLNKQRGSFGTEDQFLLQALADQGALSINNAMLTLEVGKQERIRRELQIARDIQRMLLPDKCPVIANYQLAARGSSATEVGGDYYDFFNVDENNLGIVVADVSGKGVPAALTVAMMRSVFRTQSVGNRDVRDVLSRVNAFMTSDMRRDMFITCIYGILNISERTFTYARAGHEPLLVVRNGETVESLRPDGFALGVIESPTFDELLEVDTVQLHSGDSIFFFTDGLTEAMNLDGEEFGMERILSVLDGSDMVYAQAEQRLSAAVGVHATSSTRSLVGAGADAGAGASHTNVPSRAGFHDWIEEASGANKSDLPGCAPELSSDDPDVLKWMELAVRNHVGKAAQSDDLTIVYLEAK